MKILFVWPNKDSFGFKPIGISLLSAIARRQGWQVELFDTTQIDFGFVDNTSSGEEAKIFKPVDFSKYDVTKKKLNLEALFSKELENYKPDCVAFSVLSDEFLIARQMSKIAKVVEPRIPIIWGGKFPTLNPQRALNDCYADFVCLGEGLDAFGDFIDALGNGSSPYGIANIWANKDERIIQNPLRPLRQDLDTLPYVDWEIFDKRQFLKPFDGAIYIGGDHMLNWGCPYHCTYCVNDYYHKIYSDKYFLKRYSIERIIKELKSLKDKYKLEFIKFHDEDFLMRPLDNLRDLSQSYKKEIGVPFVIETNPKSVNKENVKLLKEMNCVSASIAIETGDANLRKSILKRVDSQQDIIRAFSLFKENGIRTVSFNMFGIPFETRQTYRETIELNRKAQVQYPGSGFFYPFEGTVLRDISIKEGFFDPDEEETLVYRRDKPALHFESLTNEDLVEMRNAFVLYVKLPRSFQPFIRRSEMRDEIGKALRQKLLEIYDKTVWNNQGWYRDDGLSSIYLNELKAIVKTENQALVRET